MAAGKKIAVRAAGLKGKVTKLIVRTYENGEETPAKTVTVPLAVFRVARNLIPTRALEALQAEGIDLDHLFWLANEQAGPAVLLEVEDHNKKRKVVISVE